jgi:anaerobic selenocysteine-containing dehydrogenase
LSELTIRGGSNVGDDWKQTACSLCYVNCGVEVRTEGRAITRVRGDKAHPHSAGYLCQKAQRLTWLGNHADRLTTPLRKKPDGTHEPVDWETALGEIAERLTVIRDADRAAGRPGSFGYYGGGGQGNHSGGAYGLALMQWMNSTRYFNALSQEKTGDFWVNGHLFGSHNIHTAEGVDDCDLLLVIGCNPWLAHGFRNARSVVNEVRNDPDRRMIVIDPRRTETAAAADLHLSLRPGTDAFLLAAILALIVERRGQDTAWLAEHTEGFAEVAETLTRVPVAEWVRHAEVELADVERTVDMILAAEAMTVRVELGIQQGRHSTLNSYLEKLLFLVTGNFGRPGTNGVHSWMIPLFQSSHGQRSEITGFEYIAGLLPANTMSEEILTDHPNRIRALWVESGNPANSSTETEGFAAAIRACDLSVVVDVAYTETAALADYVLPAAAQHEKWEFTLFTLEWPTNYFHIRRPLFTPLADSLPEGEIYARLFETIGVLPAQEILDELTEVARTDREHFLERAFAVMGDHPGLAEIITVLIYRTLGASLPDNAAHIAPIWFGCHAAASAMPRQVQRALGSEAVGGALAEELFARALASPSGFAFTVHEHDEIWELIRNDKVQLAIPELLEWIDRLDPAAEQRDPELPFSLLNGQRRSHNANQILRSPGWRKSDPDGALRIHPEDLAALGLDDDEWVAVVTAAGRVTVRAEVDDSMRRGQIALPHGYGIAYPDADGRRVVNGPRINLLTSIHDRDPISGTPHHKDIPARVEAATDEERAAAEDMSTRVRLLVEAGR